MAVVAEFAGVPCSGKSTAHKKSLEYFNAQGFVNGEVFFEEYVAQIPILGRLYRYKRLGHLAEVCVLAWMHLRQLASTPKLYRGLALEILHSHAKGKVVRTVFFKLGKGLVIRKKCRESVIVDEGLIQMLFAVFIPMPGRPQRLARIGEILQLLPLPAVVIFGPDGPEEEFVRRIMVRGHHRITGNRHTKVRLIQNAVADPVLTQRASEFVAQSRSIQQALIRELQGRVEIKRFCDIGA